MGQGYTPTLEGWPECLSTGGSRETLLRRLESDRQLYWIRPHLIQRFGSLEASLDFITTPRNDLDGRTLWQAFGSFRPGEVLVVQDILRRQ